MNVIVDECCPPSVAEGLRQDGHDVIYIAEITAGASDRSILSRGLDEKRIIVTEDRDFCELVFLNRLQTYGIVLVRINPTQRKEKARRVRELFSKHESELLYAMTTLTLKNIRIRPLNPPHN